MARYTLGSFFNLYVNLENFIDFLNFTDIFSRQLEILEFQLNNLIDFLNFTDIFSRQLEILEF